jgi:hypothetical protein
MDMSCAIIPNSDQISADDLIAGPMTITITSCTVKGGQEQPVSISFEGSNRVYRPCKSMLRIMAHGWGSTNTKTFVGKSMTLYRDPSVKWGGVAVGGIRISHMTHIDRDFSMMLTATKQSRVPHKVQVLRLDAKVKPAPRGPDPLELARSKARLGKAAFVTWWNSEEGKNARADGAQGIVKELGAICAEADAAMADDPFGLPPIDSTPTDDVMARAEADARAEAERQAAEGV